MDNPAVQFCVSLPSFRRNVDVPRMASRTEHQMLLRVRGKRRLKLKLEEVEEGKGGKGYLKQGRSMLLRDDPAFNTWNLNSQFNDEAKYIVLAVHISCASVRLQFNCCHILRSILALELVVVLSPGRSVRCSSYLEQDRRSSDQYTS